MVSGPPRSADVVVIGGGPAGLAAAIAARRHGLSVVVADRGRPPVDKACGEGLMPDGVAALRAIGVDPAAMHGVPFRGIRFIDRTLAAEARFDQGCGIGSRRIEMHRALVAHAENAGVMSCWQSTVERLVPDVVTVGAQRVRCRWIVGADGLHSRVRQWAGLGGVPTPQMRVGIRQHYRVRPWTDLVEVYWHASGQAYVTPVAPNEVCVAVLNSVPVPRPDDITARFPGLAERLHGAEPIGPKRGGGTSTQRLPAVTRGRVALIGDASGSVDAVTGQGVTLAFRQAAALAEALAADDLSRYERTHRRVARGPAMMSRLLLLLGRDDRIRRLALRGLRACPYAFDRMLALHEAGTASEPDLPADLNAGLAPINSLPTSHLIDPRTDAVL